MLIKKQTTKKQLRPKEVIKFIKIQPNEEELLQHRLEFKTNKEPTLGKIYYKK